jgi:uncharacterized protein (TIGR03382 family)
MRIVLLPFCAAASLLLPVLPAQATTVIDPAASWDHVNYLYYVGEDIYGGNESFGQTITVGSTDTRLTGISFWVQDFWPVYDSPMEFSAYVMAWVGNRATGPVLYKSEYRTTTDNAGKGGFQLFTFTTGGIDLTPGGSYVVFLSASEYWDNVNRRGSIGFAGDVYSGGCLVLVNSGSDFNQVTTRNWDLITDIDMAFTAILEPVPEPSPALLGVCGLALAWAFSRRRALPGHRA